MADRLTSLDTSFLYMEDRATVMHVGEVMVFDPPGGRLDHERRVTATKSVSGTFTPGMSF